MCYRQQKLDLRGIHMACLSGDNGHGKSAILDAVTWALWGYSRLGARRDDELIYLGQDEMEVEFEFRLGQLTYRVIRKRSKRQRGQSVLELQGWDEGENRFRPLTEPTISQTQQAINNLLRMDYVTFINSAFLLQGRDDEFTVKPPGERKRVLGNILGLDIYTAYEQAAKKNAQSHKEHADQLLAAIAQMDQELSRQPEYEAALQTAQAALSQVQQERAAAAEAYDRVRAELEQVQAAARQLDELHKRIAQTRQEAARLDEALHSRQVHLNELQDALTHQADIAQGYAAFEQAVAQNQAMNAALSRLVGLNEQHSRLSRDIATARFELDKARQSAAEHVQRLAQTAAALNKQADWQTVQDQLAALQAREAEKNDLQQRIQALTAESATLTAENKQAEQNAEQIKDKMALLGDQTQAVCPLCGQPLSTDGCRQLTDDFAARLEAERLAYRQRNTRIRDVKKELDAAQAATRDIDQALRGRTALQRQEATLAHAIQEARTAAEALPDAQNKLEAIEEKLRRNDDAPDARAALLQVEQSLNELGYDADKHRQVQADVEILRAFEQKMRTLHEAQSGLETLRLALAQLQQQRDSVETRLASDQSRADELTQIVRRLPALQQQTATARQTLETAHDCEQQANLKLGAARAKVAYCADLRQQRAEREKQERQHRQEQAIYQELQQAFGKNGVQAMLIETAIPDIEEHANELLRRMTAGRMQVRFDTQRDTKRGDTIETLDIQISDELGTRSYETFSGGERYRVNFAIRVALSKLLAHRAGARLEWLVLDEGFGTQDDEGRDGLIDAIHAISQDFGCILVITHIPELRDAFNVRIQVNKTEQGSEVLII